MSMDGAVGVVTDGPDKPLEGSLVSWGIKARRQRQNVRMRERYISCAGFLSGLVSDPSKASATFTPPIQLLLFS